MYQQYILSGFSPKNLVCPNISQKFVNFNDQNTLNLSKNVSKQLIYCNTIKSSNIVSGGILIVLILCLYDTYYIIHFN